MSEKSKFLLTLQVFTQKIDWNHRKYANQLILSSKVRWIPQITSYKNLLCYLFSLPLSQHLHPVKIVTWEQVHRASVVFSENSFEIGWFWSIFHVFSTFECIFVTQIDSVVQKVFWQKSERTTSDTRRSNNRINEFFVSWQYPVSACLVGVLLRPYIESKVSGVFHSRKPPLEIFSPQ